MKNKKGFTLIELLAVIVILAIIALIATPIVMNVIEKAQKGAAERSVDNYLRAVDLAIASATMDGNVPDGSYTVMEDGNLCLGTVSGTECTGTKLEVDMSGNAPVSGTVVIQNKRVTDYKKIVVGNYTLTKDANGNIISSEDTICTPATATTVTTGNVPKGNYTNGDEYICEVKDNTFYHFFVVSTEGNGNSKLVNLIMDRNITEGGVPATTTNLGQTAWVTVADYNAKNTEEATNGTSDAVDAEALAYCSDPAMSEEGAITALEALQRYTSSWDNINDRHYTDVINPYMTFSDRPGVIEIPDPNAQSNDRQKAIWSPYSLDHTMKARLLTATEALANGCKYEINYTDENGDTVRENVYPDSCPLYLVNHLWHEKGFVSGDKVVEVNQLKGYWLSTGAGCNAYLIHNNGSINMKKVTQEGHSGIRPVITLAPSDLG